MEEQRALGVALSGGGHRATVFSLGALLYLVDSRRNSEVKAISSVSGGSITNAFIATLSKPFNEQGPDTFEPEVARFAHQIAGSREWWCRSIVSSLVLLTAWLVVVLWDFPDNLFSLKQFIVLGPLLIWVSVAGPKSGGTLWGWWGTWFYLASLVAITAIALASVWVTASSPSLQQWLWTIALLSAVALLAGVRNKIAELAFEATINPLPKHNLARGQHRALRDLPKTIRHVFCATEVHTGRHAYFSHDLFYVPVAGVANPGSLKLSTAVQSSANFPVGFPLRFFLRRRHKFIGTSAFNGPRMRLVTPRVIALSDGGVYDNTGASWFLEAKERYDDMKKWAETVPRNEDVDTQNEAVDTRTRFISQLSEMRNVPERLIIVNSSASPAWRGIGKSFIPFIGEFLQFAIVADIFYDTRGSLQAMDLLRRFLSKEYRERTQSAVVSIFETPALLPLWLTDPGRWSSQFRRIYPADLDVDDRLRSVADSALRASKHGPRFDQRQGSLARQRASVENKLRTANEQLEALEQGTVAYLKQQAQVRKLRSEVRKLKIAGAERPWNFQDMRNAFKIAGVSRYVSTTLRPLGLDATAGLLWHGYYQTMMNANLLLGLPLMEPFPPRLEDFKALAAGRRREARPMPYELETKPAEL